MAQGMYSLVYSILYLMKIPVIPTNVTVFLTGLLVIQNVLLSDSSSDEEEDIALKKEDLHEMLKFHKLQKKSRDQFYQDKEVQFCQITL